MEKGAKLPVFTAHDQNNEVIDSKDLTGQPLLIYFYPRALTPGCTTQACDMRDNMASLQEYGLKIIGISPDKPAALKKFETAKSLNFMLLSDPDKTIAKKFDAVGTKSMFGKSYEGILRNSYLFDTDGQLVQAWHKVKPSDHVALISKSMAGLTT